MSDDQSASCEVLHVVIDRRARRLRWRGAVSAGVVPLTRGVRRELGAEFAHLGRVMGMLYQADRVEVVSRWWDGRLFRAVVLVGWGIWPGDDWAVQVGQGVLEAVMSRSGD